MIPYETKGEYTQMAILTFENYEQMSKAAADLVAAALSEKPDLVLGLPTGSTPVGMYQQLVLRMQSKDISFARVTTFNLDEYVGLAGSDPQSYRYFMQENLFKHIDLPEARAFIPDGAAADPEAEALRYDNLLQQKGPLDLLILGIGHNGHIGFNEPGSPWDGKCRVVPLDAETIAANARFFEGDLARVPHSAITMGLATIMSARKIMLLASGSAKAAIIKAATQGTPSPQIPASILQKHPSVDIFLDAEAAAELDS